VREKMVKKGNKYLRGVELIDREKKYDIEEALELLSKTSFAKFDETVEVSIKLGVDPKYPDQQVRGSVLLPHGTGKETKIIVFAKGEKEKEARDAGADFAGGEDLLEKIQKGWLDFDKAVATPDMMGKVGKIGKILGPRGLMPNPKVGTVTFDIAKVVKELKSGRVEFKVDRTGVVHAGVGKKSFDNDGLKENIASFLDAILKARPQSLKGTYVKSLTLSSTMSPGIKLNVTQVLNDLKL
jgi:large subunit ribosomal protein L1